MDGLSRSLETARSVLGCVTAARFVVRPLSMREREGVRLALTDAGPLRARGLLGQAAVWTEMDLLVGDAASGVVVDRYMFALLDRNGTELLAWHYHPDSARSSVDFPHVHVSATLRPAMPDGDRGVIPLDKVHMPTGMVPLAAFVRMLIAEFGVEPLARDWEARLAGP